MLTGIVEKEDGQYASHCPELGTASCGDTIEEAFSNLEEAIEVNLNALEESETIDSVLRERHIRINSGPYLHEELLRVPADAYVRLYRRHIEKLTFSRAAPE